MHGWIIDGQLVGLLGLDRIGRDGMGYFTTGYVRLDKNICSSSIDRQIDSRVLHDHSAAIYELATDRL